MPDEIKIFNDGVHMDDHCFPWYITEDGVDIERTHAMDIYTVGFKVFTNRIVTVQGSSGGCCVKLAKECDYIARGKPTYRAGNHPRLF